MVINDVRWHKGKVIIKLDGVDTEPDAEKLNGQLIEVQGTAERAPFGRDALDAMLDLASLGIARLIRHQRGALE